VGKWTRKAEDRGGKVEDVSFGRVQPRHAFRRGGQAENAVLDAVEIDSKRFLLLLGLFLLRLLFLGLLLFRLLAGLLGFGLFGFLCLFLPGAGLGLFLLVRIGLLDFHFIALRGKRGRRIRAQRDRVDTNRLGVRKLEVVHAQHFVEVAP